jgi:predicted DNA-binding protein (MmcQ/YjbR family)
MNIDKLREICMSFPGTTEQIQWGYDLVFKVAGKMFAITPLEPAANWLTLKASPEEFVELAERPGIVPAPYLARAKWIAIETAETLKDAEVVALLRNSYGLVVGKLPRRTREKLCSTKKAPRKNRAAKSKSKLRKRAGAKKRKA